MQNTKSAYFGRFAGEAKTGSSITEFHLLGLEEALCLFAQLLWFLLWENFEIVAFRKLRNISLS